MTITLAFDVYGTLIDTQGITAALVPYAGHLAPAFSAAWREKQLEYSFRRGLMKQYETFTVCTDQALDHTCARFKIALDPVVRTELLDAYRILPAFPDAGPGLERAQRAGYRLFAFSNGSVKAVQELLRHAGLLDAFLDVVSVDEVHSFKPDPAVYAHFLHRAGVQETDAWMVSGNPFDVLGALFVGMRGAWVQRSQEQVFDTWGRAPTRILRDLTDVAEYCAPAE